MLRILHPAEEICEIMSKIYRNKLTTVSGGNLSLKDNEGNIWVSPSGGDKACLDRRDVCRILEDGETEGTAKPSLEFKIHKGIYDKRSDIRAVLHAHSPALCAMSIMRRLPDTKILAEAYSALGKPGLASYALPGSEALVKNVSDVFAEGCDAVILENHGVFIGSKTDLSDAYKKFEIMERCALSEIMAKNLGGVPHELTNDEIEKYERLANRQYIPLNNVEMSNEEILLRQSICSLTKRAYEKEIMGIAQGAFSARLHGDGMIITPKDSDNSTLSEQELVRVENGSCEMGKIPHETAQLHKLIYENSNEVQSIITVAAPYAGAFIVTGDPYDVRVIPECFNRLRACRTFDFSTFINNPEEIAKYISLKTPAAIVKNGFYIICSVSPFAAYDRAEIFEYTAKSIHYTKMMNEDIVYISSEHIEALENRFKTPAPEKVKL